MNNYYIMRKSSDPKIIGTAECQSHIQKEKFKDINNYSYLMDVLGKNYWKNNENVDKLNIELERVDLSENAILTDILQYCPILIGCPFLMSLKVRNILTKYNTCGLTFIKTFVFDGKSTHEYYLVHIAKLNENVIDYEKSIFYIGNELRGKKYIHFTSAEEKKEFSKNIFGLSMENIFLKKDYDYNRDIFYLGEIFISERIKNDLEQNDVTGVVFLPAFGVDLKWPRING